jgi:hypothetical protein
MKQSGFKDGSKRIGSGIVRVKWGLKRIEKIGSLNFAQNEKSAA